MNYRGPGFLTVPWFVSSPAPFPPLVSKLDRRHIGRLRKIEKLLTGEGGRGVDKEPNYTMMIKPVPL
jgi:hypothetical protein